MKSITSSNSISNIKEKYSKKRLSNITNRIRSLEKDISKLKNKEHLFNKKTIDNNMTLNIDKNNNTMINKESNLKQKNKYKISQKSFLKNYLFYNDNKPNIKYNTNFSSYSKKPYKNKLQKENSKSQIYSKINNYNYLIHEKKNSLLNMKMQFHRRANTKNSFKEFTKISLSKNLDINKSSLHKIDYANEQKNIFNTNGKNNKSNHHISIDKHNTNFENNESTEILKELKDSSIININKNEENNMGQLEYEFEIRHLKKKRNILKQKNKDMIVNLDETRRKNLKIEKNIIQEKKNNQNIMNNIILLNKNFSVHNNPNGLESIEISSNRSFTDEYSTKNLILNIMDIKFEYENNCLFNKFIEGINELLNIPLLNNNNFNDNILIKIKEAINIEKNLEKSNDSYKKIFSDNDKYLIYFKNLISELNLKNYEEFYEFVQKLFVKNIKESERMKQIKKALINDSSPDNQKLIKEKENIKRKMAIQCGRNVNQTLFNAHDINNNCYKIKKTYIDKVNNHKIKNKKINNYIYSKRKNSNLNIPHKLLNILDYNDIIDHQTSSTINLNKMNNLEEESDENLKNSYTKISYNKGKANIYKPLNFEQKNLYKMNISENNKSNENSNIFMGHNYYNGNNNIFNRYTNKNNIIQNEDDILYINNNEEEKIADNNFHRRSLAQRKNNSAFNIIYNES